MKVNRILENQNHLMITVCIQKNLTRLQPVLLFKDTSLTDGEQTA
jgi:hypothetical protein